MEALGLSAPDRDIVRERIRILDLVGRPFRLCELDGRGNMQTSDDVRRLIDVVGPLDPGLVSFDPLASFGAPEESVNTAAQGAVNAARRIIRELECCVRLTHHTGQQVARENLRDQYAPRGGSALSDGARMVHVISRPGDGPLPFPAGADDQAFVLSRPKCNYCPPQSDIFIKRSGFAFEWAVNIKRSPKEMLTEYADEIEAFLIDQLKGGRHHSKNTIETQELGIPRNKLRAAIDELLVSERVLFKDLPEDRRQGGFKKYLHPVNFAAQSDESGEVDPSGSSTSPGPTTSPPYREKNGGEVAAACFSSRSTTSPKCAARYGEVGEVVVDNLAEGGTSYTPEEILKQYRDGAIVETPKRFQQNEDVGGKGRSVRGIIE